jgi:uroporphyrinogen-III synthase
MMTALLTQPQPRCNDVAMALTSAGLANLCLSVYRSEFKLMSAAERLRLHTADCVVLLSPSAVHALKYALDELDARPLQSGHLGANSALKRVAAIGPGTWRALEETRLVNPTTIKIVSTETYDARTLMNAEYFKIGAGREVVIVRGSVSSTDWTARFADRGFNLDQLVVFERCDLAWNQEQFEQLRKFADSALHSLTRQTVRWVMTTSSSAQRIQERILANLPDCAQWLFAQPCLAIHPQIATACRAIGWTNVQVISPGTEVLLAALKSADQHGNEQRV